VPGLRDAGVRLDGPILYDSRDLTTHAVMIGMPGSGKAGLGTGLIEEEAASRSATPCSARSSVGRRSRPRAADAYGRAREQAARVGQAEENVGAAEALRPKAADVRPHTFGLARARYVSNGRGGLTPAWS
jgi:hypothetical protein